MGEPHFQDQPMNHVALLRRGAWKMQTSGLACLAIQGTSSAALSRKVYLSDHLPVCVSVCLPASVTRVHMGAFTTAQTNVLSRAYACPHQHLAHEAFGPADAGHPCDRQC